uniref:AAA_12 domain-containing protein n=1 Tax=Haemonchus contortus TaxID=6289 RepID=A0A7I5ECZ1_HAECO
MQTGPPTTRSQSTQVDSWADDPFSGIVPEASASENLANALSYLDDKASVRSRDAKSSRDATVLALEEVHNDSKVDTAQMTKQINEENSSVAYGRTLDLGVELSTVDSVQGREKEVVVILTTKNDFSPDEADFFDDYRRLNVAVSRCRHGQFIFGYATALRALPMWDRLLNWAESIRSVIRMADVNRYMYGIHPEPSHR